jgi:hypothetical protein
MLTRREGVELVLEEVGVLGVEVTASDNDISSSDQRPLFLAATTSSRGSFGTKKTKKRIDERPLTP